MILGNMGQLDRTAQAVTERLGGLEAWPARIERLTAGRRHRRSLEHPTGQADRGMSLVTEADPRRRGDRAGRQFLSGASTDVGRDVVGCSQNGDPLGQGRNLGDPVGAGLNLDVRLGEIGIDLTQAYIQIQTSPNRVSTVARPRPSKSRIAASSAARPIQ
jgi:hypothetical protein